MSVIPDHYTHLKEKIERRGRNSVLSYSLNLFVLGAEMHENKISKTI